MKSGKSDLAPRRMITLDGQEVNIKEKGYIKNIIIEAREPCYLSIFVESLKSFPEQVMDILQGNNLRTIMGKFQMAKSERLDLHLGSFILSPAKIIFSHPVLGIVEIREE